MTQKIGKSNTLYLNIAQGNMVQKADKDNPDAVKRVYTDDDGTEHTKYEVRHRNLTGHIVGLKFDKGDYGERLQVLLVNDEGERAQLSIPNSDQNNDYFVDFAKRVAAVDLTKEVTINPYSIKGDGDEYANRGVSIKQDGETVKNYYFDGKKAVNGIPEVSDEDRKEFVSEDWKIHFMTVRKFLKKQILAMELPNFEAGNVSEPKTEEEATPPKKTSRKKAAQALEQDDLPF